jgi:hypothetical protein
MLATLQLHSPHQKVAVKQSIKAQIGHRWVTFDTTRMSPPERRAPKANGLDAKDVAIADLQAPQKC